MTTERELRKLLKGTPFTLRVDGSHLNVCRKDGSIVTGISSHPSDGRSRMNFRSQLRALGIEIPGKNHVKKEKR